MRAFVAREIVPHFDEWERRGLVDKALFGKAGAAGVPGLSVPEELGGGGQARLPVQRDRHGGGLATPA